MTTAAAKSITMTSNPIELSPSVKPLLVWLLVTILAASGGSFAGAQGVKGGGGSGFSQQFTTSTIQQPQVASSGQLSSSFVQMFNQLTPIQQQQFIKQMSSSNKRIFQQAIQVQPQPQFSGFSEEISSTSSGQQAPQQIIGGTKSFRSSSSPFGNQQNAGSVATLSPAQLASYFRSQQTKTVAQQQPTITIPSGNSQFSFSRQITQNVQQPTIIAQPQQQANEQIFQKTFTNTVQPQPQPQPQQSSYFNRVQQVQQIAQPVVLPSSEQSFRRVQSFSSQPLVVQQPAVESSSGFTQQFISQQQPQPIQQQQQNFNRFQQQFSSSQTPLIQPTTGFTNQQFSTSSSSNLAGGQTGQQNFLDGSGFSGALQQEKVTESSLGAVDGSQLGAGFTNQFGQFGQQNSLGSNQNSFDSTTGNAISASGFDSADAQQKNSPIPDDFYGLTAASINNKWYIMRPVENPSAFGLGDATSGKLKQIPISRALVAAPQQPIKSSSGATNITASVATPVTTPVPKKRSVSPKKVESVETDKPARSSESSSSSSNDGSNEDDGERK